MLKLGAFENSLRGGPDISTSINGGTTTPKTKQQILQKHHKSCTGEHHGSGIEKWKRNQGIKPHHHHHHHRNSSVCSAHYKRSTSQCSSNSLDYSDTDSGQESLTSPLQVTKLAQCEDTSNYDCCSCDNQISRSSHRLHSTPTKASAAKTAFSSGHFDGDEVDVGKMTEDESCVIPKNDNSGEDLEKNGFVGQSRQSAKMLALEGVEKITDRLSMRRKKRNERIAEHVDGSAKKIIITDLQQRARRSKPIRLSLNSKTSEESIDEEKNGNDSNLQKSVSIKTSCRNGSAKRPTELNIEDSSLKNVKSPESDLQRSKKISPTKSHLSRINGKGSQESVTEECRSGTPTRNSLKPSSRVVNGKGHQDSGTPLKSGVPSGRGTQSSGLRKPSGRRPPTGSKKFSGVCKVSWSELAETSLNTKPNTLSTTGKNILYKDINQLVEDSKNFPPNEQAKSEEQLATEKTWLEAERLWLVHRAGFSAARRLPEDSSGSGGADSDTSKLRVRLEATGEVLQVDDDDVEKANPPQFDRAEDLAHLRYVNESSVLHTLRQRYGSNLIHTYAGGSMVVVNPMAPLAIHSEKVVHMFRGCKSEDMPPHIYSLAQSAYHGMLASRRDHSIALLGRSGSGKTTNFKHILHYLVLAAGAVNKVVTVEKLNAISTVLEAFGNSRTVLNTNATRFTQIFSLDFDQSGQIASASVQVFLAERSRVARRPEGEPTFHIFYRLLAGVEGTLRRELHLDNISGETNLFMTPLQKHEDKQKAMLDFARVCAGMQVLGFSDAETKVIWSVLAAIYHLGIAGAVKAGNSSSSRWQFSNPQAAQQAAHLLGTTVEELARVLFGQSSGGMGTPSTPRAPFRTPSPTDRGLDRDVTGLEALEGMVIGLYGEVLNAVSALINRSISTPIHTVASLVVVDSPGFQNPASCGQQGGATFEDLCHNYLQERLQLLFHHTTLVAPKDRYAQEHIELNLDEGGDGDVCSPGPLVSLLDRTSQNSMVRTSQTDLREADRRGLLWLLDEEAVYPGASDEGFLERLFAHYGDRDHQLLLRKAPGTNQFILQHLQGTNPVLYTASGWLKASRENPIARSAVALLQESTREEMSQLFVSVRGLGVSSALGGSVVGIEGTQSLRRASSIRRTFTTGTAGIKRKSVCLQVKFTVDGLVETLRRTRLKFVHCFLPHHNAALGDSARSSTLKSNSSLTGSNISDDLLINVPLVRSQLRGAQILDAVRLHKQGFPKFLPLSEFRRRFRLLAPSDGRPASPVLDERRAVEDMLLGIEIDLASYRVGLSQLLLTPSLLFWILLLIITFLLLTQKFPLHTTTDTSHQTTMPAPECTKQPSVSNLQKFYTNHNRTSPPLHSKSLPSLKNKASSSRTVNSNGTGKTKSNNGTYSEKCVSSGSSSGDDTFDRSEHAPRVVAVAMKDHRIKVSCRPPLRNLSPGKHSKDNKISNQNGSPPPRGKNNGYSDIKQKISQSSVSLGQILTNGSSGKKEDNAKKLPSIPRTNSLILMTHAAEKNQQADKPLFLPRVSTSSGSVNGSGNNLSTVIAVNSARGKEEIHTGTTAKYSTKKPVVEDEPLSSTVISVNCDENYGDRNLKPPLLPSKMKDFNGKSLVWREIKQRCMQNQPSAGTRVTVNISSEAETPPPVPPLPVALRTKFFNREGKAIVSKELPPKPIPVASTVNGKQNGKAPLPLNRLCLHPKIKLKSLQSSPPAFNHKPSKIPKLRPSPTGLRSVDCLVSLYEDGIAAERKRKAIQKEGEQKKKISRVLKQSWEELFKKYEALEKECDSISSVTSGSDCSSNSFSSKSFNSFGSKSCSDLLDTKKNEEDNKQVSSHNEYFKTNKQNGRCTFRRFEVQRLKSAPSSLLHLSDAIDDDGDKGKVSDIVISRTSSEINLCSKSVKEQKWPKVLVYKENASFIKEVNSEKEINNNCVVSKQVVSEGDLVPDSGVVKEQIQTGAGSLETGGIGIVRANTGRQVSHSRYRTELEIFFRSGVLAQLEAQRDERLTDNVVRLQARCRGYLARRKLNKLKIQDLAVRCIQRNVRKFMSVRDWPWWRLLVRVTPLLNVHRTEEELRNKTEELEQLRAKVEKLEQERSHLKHDNDRLEAKLSEMTADLAEEHSTSTLATERLEAETADRLRLEKELQDIQSENRNLQQGTERLEMELLYMRAADVNGGVGSDDDEDGEGDAGVYRQRYERTVRELEFTRRRLQQQHEDDLEQLVGLKKQLEKKLADAFEEVEEQRQVVGQWKRKVQKLNAETNDLRLLLEEQNSRNHLLEKKQRKFDSELQLLHDELRQEKQQRDRTSREKELIVAEKYSLEQNLSGVRLELELKEEKVASLTRELDELTFGGKTEEEVAHLKKTKHEMDKKIKEQEEELDDLAGQVQLLEQAKLRLEMSLEQQRKENRRELSQRDEELEDIRCNAQKKVKALEAQLESEHEERTQLLREKHELERRLGALEEIERANRATDEDQLHRLRKDLRRTKALLRDAQTQLERSRGDSPGKAILRQLRNQLEDLECARAAAVKARQSAEMELGELQAQLDEAQRVKAEAEERAAAAARERSDIRTQLEENEEELAEVLKKYRTTVQQLSVEQMALQEQAGLVAELESERASLKEQLAELSSRLESIETQGDPSSSLAQRRLELRTKELESRLELEQTTRARMEVQISRLKETVEKLQGEAAMARAKEQTAQDSARKLQRTVRELKEESSAGQAREAEAAQRRKDLEKRLESAEAEAAAARGDLRLALTRIQDLQSAIQGELEDCSGSDHSDSDQDSDGSDESINTFLSNHKMPLMSSTANSSPRVRASLDLDITPRSLESPSKVHSSVKNETKESFA